MTKYLREIFLYSGQYALFYLLMNLSLGINHFFSDNGHIVLLVALVLQIIFSVKFIEDNSYKKALFSFLSPLIYTLYDGFNNSDWIYGLGHSFFWIFTFLIAINIIIENKTTNNLVKIISEVVITFLNIAIFVAIYFYFDLKLSQTELLNLGTITPYEFKESLEIYNFFDGFLIFLKDPAHIYIVLGGLFLGSTIAYNRVQNLKLTQKIDRLLGTYLDIAVKNRLLSGEQNSQKKELTILFCDIRNFTGISEKYDANEIVETLNIYYSFWADEVLKHNGVINKFIGDAVMVIFGLDGDKNKGVKNSIDVSNAMLKNLPKINTILKNKNLPTLDGIGVGIHCGEVVLGAIGGSERKDYTVIGDSVNIASRIESLCKTYTKELLISYEAYQLCGSSKDKFVFVDDIFLKGKNNSKKIYALK